MAAALSGLLVIPVLLFGSELVGYIPQAALAGVLLVVAWGMIDKTAVRRLWKAAPETRLLLAEAQLGAGRLDQADSPRVKHPESRIGGRDPVQRLAGAVGAAVIDADHIEGLAQGLPPQRRQRGAQVGPGVVHRKKDRDPGDALHGGGDTMP